MVFAVFLTLACFAVGLWNLFIAVWASFAENRLETVGTLAKVSSFKNVRTRYGFFPNLSDCVYVYCVGGRQYKYRVEEKKSKQKLFKKVSIVYIKGFPRYAGIRQYRTDLNWVLAVGFFLLGAFLLWSVLYL